MSIKALRDYVLANTAKAAIGTGTTHIEFFDVTYSDGVNADTLRELVENAHEGEFGTTVNLFDGQEKGYIELGAWIGDQGIALQLMALGSHLKLWQLLAPSTLMPAGTPDALKQQMAQAGMITVTSAGMDNRKEESTDEHNA